MTTRLLSSLIEVTDLDYVDSFQSLSAVNVAVRRDGATPQLLLRKASLELAVGNFAASVAAARDAVALAPLSSETHHQLGVSFLYLGLAKAGTVPAGPGLHENTPDTVSNLLRRALDAWREALRLAPGDEETEVDIAVLDKLLKAHDGEAKLVAVLRAL